MHRHLRYLRKPALTMIKTWHPDSISLSERQRALMMTSDLTLVWEDQNSWIHLKLGCWSWIPFPELSEESASFCIPRQGLYFTNNLHLDSVVLLVGLSIRWHTFYHSPGAARTWFKADRVFLIERIYLGVWCQGFRGEMTALELGVMDNVKSCCLVENQVKMSITSAV